MVVGRQGTGGAEAGILSSVGGGDVHPAPVGHLDEVENHRSGCGSSEDHQNDRRFVDRVLADGFLGDRAR